MPFVQVDPADRADLRRRLLATRWPDAPEDAGWSLGTDLDHLREVVRDWAAFDLEAWSAGLARLPRRTVRLDALDLHVVHARAVPGAGPALPLVLCHGWPDSSWRFETVVPLLTDPGAHGADPADAFDVVVPDMPGFGWSQRPPVPLDSVAVAGLWARLMTALGYERFGAAGGDIGSHVSRYLALDHPDRVVAVHRTDAGVPVPVDPAALTPAERDWVAQAAAWGAAEGAYAAVHRTKPQSLAVGLTDSPAGLAAWLVEKLHAWSDPHGHGIGRDAVLDLLSRYWFTGTIGSSLRMDRANAAIPAEQHARRVEVPSGFSLFPGDLLRPPRAWLERTTRLVRVTEPARGGHFAPVEEPELYAQELRDFFRPYR
ncbi:epoxide hydrolase family protein [Cellulomonas endophytica]|uniref:epoxide hydrolase family protein n=1 Tax=Cellulomonas endophytica TaxID=2494735 RepID=UPI00196B1B86|nr:epoxide hydrolase family protein [Cellulomonas endophytica]